MKLLSPPSAPSGRGGSDARDEEHLRLSAPPRWEMVLLADPTESLYSMSDFDAFDVQYVEKYTDDLEKEVRAECTCVWRFELDADEGFEPPLERLRRDVCFFGECKFGNYHCAHGGGYVLCDGEG